MPQTDGSKTHRVIHTSNITIIFQKIIIESSPSPTPLVDDHF